MANLTQKAKITLTDFNPKQIAAHPAETKKLDLGVLLIRAIGTSERTSPDGTQKFTGLRGDFEAHFVQKDANGNVPDPWSSGVLFMPDTFQDKIVDLLADKLGADGKTIVTKGADAVNTALNIAVQRANNPQGYEWLITPLIDVAPEERKDPLADLRKYLPGGASAAPAIADQSAPAGKGKSK